MTDKEGNDILCNPLFGELFDVDPEEIVHSKREDVRKLALSRVADPDEFNNLIESIYSDPTIERSDEIELRTTPPRILARYTAPVYDLLGNNIGRLWTFSDVTETRRLQSEVRFYGAELERQLELQKREYEITAETLRVLTEINNVVATVSDRREVVSQILHILPSLNGWNSAAIIWYEQNRAISSSIRADGKIRHRDISDSVNALDGIHRTRELRFKAELPEILGFTPKCSSVVEGEDQSAVFMALGSDVADIPPPPHWKSVAHHVAQALEINRLHSDLQTANNDLQMVQDSLIESEKLGAVGRLAAAVAHDIRNIITPLQLELAMAGPVHGLSEATAQFNRLSALTHRLLAIARPGKVMMMPVEIQEIVDHVLPLVRAQADVNGVIICSRFPSGPVRILGDSARLEHLFINLLLNAIDAMSERGGQLQITGRCTQDSVKIEIADAGRGIPEDQISRLFDPFFTTRANGSGLGLFSVKSIVEEHRGGIAVASKVGVGTTFTITFEELSESL